MKKFLLSLLAFAALVPSALAAGYIEYPIDPSNGPNLFLNLKADTLYLFHDGPKAYDLPDSDPEYHKGDMIPWKDGSQGKFLCEYLAEVGITCGVGFNTIIIYADTKSTLSRAIEFEMDIYPEIKNVYYIIPPKYWHETPVCFTFPFSEEGGMEMEEYLADPANETQGLTANFYEEGQGLWKKPADSYLNIHTWEIFEAIGKLDTEDYPYLHVKVPAEVTLVNYVAGIDEIGKVKQEFAMRLVDSYFIPVESKGKAIDFFYEYVRSDLLVPTWQRKFVDRLAVTDPQIESLPVFCFDSRTGSIECAPGTFYYKESEESVAKYYSFWVGPTTDPRATRGAYFLDFTVCIDGSVSDVQPSEIWAANRRAEDWEYVIERLKEEPYWRPGLDHNGKPVNVRLHEVRVYLDF